MKVLVCFGTRPEAIKLAPLIRHLRSLGTRYQVQVCVTAQHRQMLDQALEFFELKPEHDLDLMRPAQSLNELGSRILAGLGALLKVERPDLLLVQGDTTTTCLAALAAFYEGIPVGHVEAGLRTYDLRAPFPEEGNRQMTSRLAALHFTPTEANRQALLAEGIPAAKIHVTGNTVIDALFWAREKVRAMDAGAFEAAWGSAAADIRTSKPLVLITGHRRESFGSGFERICSALRRLALQLPGTAFVYPVHLNPQVQEPVLRLLVDLPNMHLIAPLDYAPFIKLMDRSTVILTDSGGVQEEAPSLGKPVLVMRDTTERQEAVEAGSVKLVGTDEEAIIREMTRLLADPAARAAMATIANPYGDGHACERIEAVLATWRP